MPESSQEKTEQPTPKRLRDARKKGQVFHSKDLDAVVILLAAFSAIAFSRSFMMREFRDLMQTTFQAAGQSVITMDDIYRLGKLSLLTLVKVLAPILGTTFLTAALVGFLQVGPVFSIDPLKPSLKKLNAIENLQNMMKPKTLFELFKNIVKVIAVSFIAYGVLKGMLEPFLMTVSAPIDGSAALGAMVIIRFMIRFLILFILVAILDVMMQRHEYIKNLKMSKDEVKREYKEDEGDPLIKGHRKQLHMEMAMGDVKQRVKTADAVITNPTHLAIAIKYDKGEMAAPQVVAKGQRLFAEYIRDLAKEHDIPIIRNIPLAWSLIELEIDDEIPETLFVAVAEILTFVYKLKEGQKRGAGNV